MLGLGLGLHKSSTVQSSFQKLLKLSSALWRFDMPDGVNKLIPPNLNTPFINPVEDMAVDANITLQNFAGTSADGYSATVAKGVGQDGEYTNLVTNGDFSQGTTGWNIDSASISVSAGNLIATGTGAANICGVFKEISGYRNTGIRLSKKVRVRVLDAAGTLFLFCRDGAGGTVIGGVTIASPVVNKWYEVEVAEVITTPGSFTNDLNIFIRANYADAATANGKRIEIDYAQLVQLTDNPLVQSLEAQLGRQLTVAECDYLFTFTPSTATLMAKVITGLKLDGVDSYGIANNPALDITGTGDFGFGDVVKTSTLTTQYLFSKSEQSEATTQYALKLTNTGVLSVILEGTSIQLATGLLANTLYSVWVERISGVLKCFINGVEVFNVANVASLTSRPNFRLGNLSTNVGGTTHTGFSNSNVFTLVIVKTDVLKARSEYFNFTLKTFGI